MQFKRFWETEKYGTEGEENQRTLLSEEDQKAVTIVQEGTRKLNPGYEVPIPWRTKEPTLKNNKTVALRRLIGLMKKFAKEPEYQKEYQKAVRKYLNDGYAEKITQKEELDHPNQWFLLRHGVYKKSAEEKKLRIVFDATEEFGGKSLNNSMLTGPKLQSELPEILLEFREIPIALGADIEAMFSRIRLTKADARYHRFLMTEPTTGEVEVYQMNKLTFGDAASPFIAMATLHKTAEDYGGGQERACRAIKKNFYMDDYLDSFDPADEAIRVGRCVKDILRKGDFNLTKWTSNSAEVRRTFDGEEIVGTWYWG